MDASDTEEPNILHEDSSEIIVPAPSREDERVATLEPVVSYHLLHARPLTDLYFFPDALVTASSGFAKIWNRPTKTPQESDTEQGSADSK